MSFALDTNVLVYAATSGSPVHRKAAALLDECRSQADHCYLTWPTITGYLRLARIHVPDAHVATILRQHRVKTLYTNDADVRRFPLLEVRDPFAA
jgi:predicted nucleic acid-binding protein